MSVIPTLEDCARARDVSAMVLEAAEQFLTERTGVAILDRGIDRWELKSGEWKRDEMRANLFSPRNRAEELWTH